MNEINIQELHKLLYYDPDTGNLHWRVENKYARIKPDTVAGCVDSSSGYIRVRVLGKKYLAHRIVWALVTGKWPENQIDHIDRDRTNNKFMNLRSCTNAENQQNCSLRKDNSSGYKGVSWNTKGQVWEAYLSGEYVGRAHTAESAYQLYLDRKKNVHKFNPIP